jgi:small multidrug resistance pump
MKSVLGSLTRSRRCATTMRQLDSRSNVNLGIPLIPKLVYDRPGARTERGVVGPEAFMEQQAHTLHRGRIGPNPQDRPVWGYRMADLLMLLVAIACELTATSLLKESNGLSRFWPSAGVAIGYVGAFVLLAIVLQRLPVGPVYAIWAGLGTAGAAVIGLIAYGDRLPTGGWLGVGLVMAGVVMLGLYAPHSH